MVLPNPLKARASLIAGFGDGFGLLPQGRTVHHGSSATFGGRLTMSSDAASGGRSLTVIERFDQGAAEQRRATTVTTDDEGRFSVRLGAGPSREVFALFGGTSTAAGTASRPLRLGVRAAVGLRASSRAEEVGVSERTLRRAAKQGTLRAWWPTARRLDISQAEKHYVRRSWPLLADLRGALRTEHNVRFAALFGSAARGEDGPESDIDLVVEMREGGLDRLIALELKLEAALGRPADIVALEEAESKPELLYEIVTEGRVVVDREYRWSALQARLTMLRRSASRAEREQRRAAFAGIDRLLGRR
jgi:predicted nucleotidyltransferase